MKYEKFLKSKRHLIGEFGFDPVWFPEIAFDFQKEVITQGVNKGRIAYFLDTGLGKTLIQLATAYNVVLKTNKPVLILTPLAVGFQFLEEAKKIGISDICQTKKGEYNKKIVVCNYERIHYLNPLDFEAVILDESSILKNFKGRLKEQLTIFMKKVKYRFLATATPSPNDFIELGTSSEILGYMGYMDMLSKFFRNSQNTADSSNLRVGEKYYLKPHAEKDFFNWVSQWSIMAKMPSDLGYSNERYNLPKLITKTHKVKNKKQVLVGNQFALFNNEAKSFSEVRQEQKDTIVDRCEKAYELSKGKTSVYWVNLNAESSYLNDLDNDAIEIKGSQSIDQKEEILQNFSHGNIKRLITKAKMTGMGLNWQHCNNTVFFPTFSYEQYYQAIRRFWRFGQRNDVTCHLVISDGQTRVLKAIEEKTEKAIELYENLIAASKKYKENIVDFDKEIQKPTFL